MLTCLYTPMSNPQPQQQLDLVYGLNDRPKPFVAFLAALQHLLAILVPIVTLAY